MAKQEQLPARDGVLTVGPGVRRVQLPVRFTGLGHVNMYVLEDARGVTLVDPGLPGRATWAAIRRGLRQAEVPLERVHTVLVTHSHPDHFGGVARLLASTPARMLAHGRYRTWWKPHGHLDLDLSDEEQAIEEVARRGNHPWGDPEQTRGLRAAFRGMGPRNLALGAIRSPAPTVRVEDGDTIEMAGRAWQAVHTPGHTGDHLCVFDPEQGLLLSGDHVLPTITPHVGAIGAGLDPLGSYLDSLAKVAGLDGVRLVLPAHGDPFESIAGRTGQIRQHHELRLAQLRDALRAGPASTRELARSIYPERHWGFLAESETYAHLVHLERTGLLQRIARSGGPPVFEIVPS
ncbi:MAG: MBL fold metallo-hydrolase [Acidimicrobiia bacterium]|nr:MBL fold metallo-hydrolase [Acidimicrobiia bacterium]